MNTESRQQLAARIMKEAMDWLESTEHHEELAWWNTPLWGESPADFGYKKQQSPRRGRAV